MPQAQYIQSNFTAGEFSPRLNSRVDIRKYGNAAATIRNYTVTPHGGCKKRPGTRYITRVKGEGIKFIPFSFNTIQSYMLAFGPGYTWFFKDGGIITFTTTTITDITNAASCTLTMDAAHGLTVGDWVYITGVEGMHQINNYAWEVTTVGSSTTCVLDCDTTGFGAYSSGGEIGEIVEITTPYTLSEIPTLTYAQSADVLYIAHPNHEPQTLTRSSDTSWTLAALGQEKGPFRPLDDRGVTLSFSSWSGSASAYGTRSTGQTATMTASGATFDSGMVGTYFRLLETPSGALSGIPAPALGDTSTTLANGDVYTFDEKVYGVSSLSGTTDWGPFNRVPNHDAGAVSVAAGAASFNANYIHDGTCIVKITAYASSTSVTIQTVYNHMPASIVSGGSSAWQEGAWSTYRGWPQTTALFEQRLWFGGNPSEPATLWSSRTGLYTDFEDGPEADNALVINLVSGLVDDIRWLYGGKVLMAGTAAGEYVVSASSQQEALSPENQRATMQTAFGASNVQPIRIGQVVLYPQRHGDPSNPSRRLREFSYNFQNDAFQSVDLSVFSEHILSDGFVDITYQLSPDSIAWMPTSAGEIVGMTYERDQEVVAWHRHDLGGTASSVVSVGATPGQNGDDLYVYVERTINGATAYYIEMMSQYEDEAEKQHLCFLDGAILYTGASVTEITSLHHLEGETVDVLNNGGWERNKVVSSGSITLSAPSNGGPVYVGLQYFSDIVTLDVEAGARDGTAQGKTKAIHKVYMKFYRSLGGSIGPRLDSLEEMLFRKNPDPLDASPPLFSGYYEHNLASNDALETSVAFRHDAPYPSYVAAIVSEVYVNT